MNVSNTERLITIAQAGELLAVSKRTVYRLIEGGRLNPVYVTPGTPRLRLGEVTELISGPEQGQ